MSTREKMLRGAHNLTTGTQETVKNSGYLCSHMYDRTIELCKTFIMKKSAGKRPVLREASSPGQRTELARGQ